MGWPKISIITPTYNQAEFIEDTILSVIGQNYQNLEYIIIDGGSTDKTIEIIKKYESKLTFWVSENDRGQSHAINKGFQNATGDILMWLNSDDILLPNVLYYVSNQVKINGSGLYFGNCIFLNDHDQNFYCQGSNVILQSNKFNLEENAFIIQPSSFWTKDVWEKTGFINENLQFALDWEWFIRVKKNNFNLFPLQKCISIYRFHNKHKSGIGGLKRQEEILSIYFKYLPEKALLYKNLMHEKFQIHNLKFKIIKFILFFFNKNVSLGLMLKYSKFKKYKSFTVEEINQMQSML